MPGGIPQLQQQGAIRPRGEKAPCCCSWGIPPGTASRCCLRGVVKNGRRSDSSWNCSSQGCSLPVDRGQNWHYPDDHPSSVAPSPSHPRTLARSQRANKSSQSPGGRNQATRAIIGIEVRFADEVETETVVTPAKEGNIGDVADAVLRYSGAGLPRGFGASHARTGDVTRATVGPPLPPTEQMMLVPVSIRSHPSQHRSRPGSLRDVRLCGSLVASGVCGIKVLRLAAGVIKVGAAYRHVEAGEPAATARPCPASPKGTKGVSHPAAPLSPDEMITGCPGLRPAPTETGRKNCQCRSGKLHIR